MEAYATNEAKRNISAVRSAEKEGADESATFYIFLPQKFTCSQCFHMKGP